MTIDPNSIPKPKANGITPEAAEALGIPDNPILDQELPPDLDTGSAGNPEPSFPWDQQQPWDAFASPNGQTQTESHDYGPDDGPFESGDNIIVDAEIVDDDVKPASRIKVFADDEGTKPRGEPKSGPPGIDEWMGFFSRVVLRVICDWYISWAFRGIDEDMLTDREVNRLTMTEDERKGIAAPFAELSYKSKFMRKHGRTIVASGDSIYALVVFGAWASRVSRIAKKYRRPQPVRQQRTANANGSAGQSEESGGVPEGANGGRIPSGVYRVVNPGG